MKYLQRYLSLLFALVMCVSLFSITAHAEEVNDDYVYIQTQIAVWNDVYNHEYICYPQNGTIERTVYDYDFDDPLHDTKVRRTFYVAKKDKSHLFVSGRDVVIRLENIPIQNAVIYNNKGFNYNVANNWSVAIYYLDNTVAYVSDFTATQDNNGDYDLVINFAPTKDVAQIYIVATTDFRQSDKFNQYVYSADIPFGLSIVAGEKDENSYLLSFEQDSKEVGILNGIKNAITGLPNALWEKISSGLKSLFVPSEESMIAYKDKWDELLASRFGAVYQVVNIMTDSWDGIMQADETNTIDFPQATINLSGTPFTFGGYSVKIVPDGFDVLVTAIKSIVAIVCTVAFVNGMRKRYDEIMGVEQ